MSTKSIISSMTCSGTLINTNSVEWSADNAISVIINKGIYIFESHCDPSEICDTFQYHKCFIQNFDDNIIFDVGVDIKELLSTCSREEQHSMMLDNALMPDTANAPNFRCYRLAKWSPITVQYGCVLALLTLDYRLTIFTKRGSVWHMSCDLSLDINEQLKSLWDSIESPNYRTYKERVYSCATVAICWANKCVDQSNDSQSCLLYVGSKNGLITIWNIFIDQQISAQLVYKWRTNFDQITSINCFNDYLIIASFSGLIVVIHSGFCYDDMPNPLTLWSDEDQIPVYHFAQKMVDENSFDVIFTKATYVVICRIEAENTGDSITLNLKCCKSVEGVHQMPSTGICSIMDSSYYLTSMDGRLIQIDVLPDLTLKQYEISLEDTNFAGMCAYGIDSSPNSAMTAIAQTLTVYHDHLVIKEPVQIVFFSNFSFNQLNELLRENYFNANPRINFGELAKWHDFLDCLKAYLINFNQICLDQLLLIAMNSEDNIKTCCDPFKLKLIRFIAKAIVSYCQTKISDIDVIVLQARAELCEQMLLKLHIQSLYDNINDDASNLSNDQIVSLKNMDLWLSQCFETFSSANVRFECGPEICPICGKHIMFEHRSHGSCEKSHHFMRCVNSLLLCDIAKNKYEKCSRCRNNVIIKPPVWKKLSVCLFCS